MAYNLEVEGDHTYFVGDADGGVWVHNACRFNDLDINIRSAKAKDVLRKGLGKGWEQGPVRTYNGGWVLKDAGDIERFRFMTKGTDSGGYGAARVDTYGGYWIARDSAGNFLDINGNIVPQGSEESHIPYLGGKWRY